MESIKTSGELCARDHMIASGDLVMELFLSVQLPPAAGIRRGLNVPFAAMVLTPGVKFILAALPKLTLPGAVVYLAANHSNYPRWACILAALSAGPLLAWLRSQYEYLKEEREIAALGAVRVPEVKGKWPWNLDLILGRLKQGKDGYPCQSNSL